ERHRDHRGAGLGRGSPGRRLARHRPRPGGGAIGRVTDPLARSRNDLDAARLLAERGFGAQAVSRAYFAAFHAAEAALGRLGETRSKHAGVLSAFGRLVVLHGGFDEETGRLLRSLFERRNEADYVPVDVP